MSKALSYVIPFIVAFLACMPHVPTKITAQGPFWTWIITSLGFLGIYTLALKATSIVKFVAVAGFILCFFSRVPYASFNAYFLIVASCYFYIGAVRMHSWKPTFRILQVLLTLHLIFLGVQLAGSDKLLNFGEGAVVRYGIIGPHMQEASFMVILSAVLIQKHPVFFILPVIAAFVCNSTWSLLCVAIGLWVCFPFKILKRAAVIAFIAFIVMGVATHKFEINLAENNRLDIWWRTLILCLEHPIKGWGPGTFKFVFPGLNPGMQVHWKSVHNDWLQFLFELGSVFTATIVLAFSSMLYRIRLRYEKRQEKYLLASLLMVAVDMVVHFPVRTFQIFPLILLLLAFCEESLRRNTKIPV